MATLIEELLRSREGSAVDFKVDASAPRGIVKCFVALGNTAGGRIVVGVGDDRKVVGLVDPQAAEQAISNAIYSSTEPPQRPRISFATHEEKEVVIVDAQFFQGAEPLKLKERGKLTVYERVGSNAIPVTDTGRLEQIKRERQGRDGFDQLPVPRADLQDLDLQAIEQAFGEVGVDIEDAKLESYELATRQSDKLVPTHAGLLLFGREPNRFLPDAYFRAIRYPGVDKGGDALDSEEWPNLSLLAAIDEVERFIARNTGTAQTLSGRKRRDIAHYDGEVLREVLHNAIGHADYSAEGLHLNVSIYSDRLVVDSPGQMPVGMSVEQLEEGISRVRNRAIMSILHKLGYVEKHGTAYAKALAAAERGYPLPKWTEPGPILRVTIEPHPQAIGSGPAKRSRKTDRTQEILMLLADSAKSAADLALDLEVTPRQIQRILKKMEDAGEVETTGGSRNSPKFRYRLPG
jgi:ATP-dependent DNA helicase RecG